MYHYQKTSSKRKLPGLAFLLSVLVMMLCNFNVKASEAPAPETATGTVVDQFGEPLVGVSVMVPGTSKGASTDVDGNFSIANVNRGESLRFTMIGCKPYETKWQGTPLNITMEDDVASLDEVVVVGFGVQKKANLTGAVSTITATELSNRPVASAVDALAGLAPGLNINGANLGGQLNATKSMNIRGVGTIGSGSSVTPLVLIDGMEGDLNTVNPQDIENISILKDAASASIYGSRAAGGVILVTTKNGKEGKLQVTYNNSFRWSSATNFPHQANSYLWAITANEAAMNAGQGVYVGAEKLQQLKDVVEGRATPNMWEDFGNPGTWCLWGVNGTDTSLPTGNTDWLYAIFGKTSFSQEHNISLTGGTDKINTYFSANILDQGGLLNYGDDKRMRYNITGRMNFQITPWLLFGYAAKWSRVDYNAPSLLTDNVGGGMLYHDISRNWPVIPLVDPNGHYVVQSFIPTLTEGGRFLSTNDRLDHQFSFLINPLQGLTINADMNYSARHYKIRHYYLQTYWYDINDNPYKLNSPDSPVGPEQSRVYNFYRGTNYFNPNAYATYQFNIKQDHQFKVMAGFQAEWLKNDQFSAQRTGIIADIPYLDKTDGDPVLGGTAAEWSTAGFFGRINYDYKGRYLIEGNLRYDGTSRFRRGHRWSTSPSFSLGWNVANEAWFESVRQKVNTLKVRYSWGKLGNQNTNSWYPTYSSMGFVVDGSSWLVDGSKTTVASMPGIVSSSLTWEKNRTWDIGLDWGFLNNRLTGTFDYYNRKTMDMVGPGQTLPGVLGVGAPATNNLSMTSKGWELTVSWRDRIQDFAYGVTLNLYDHTTIINEYPNPGNSLSQYYPGRKYGEIWGYTSIGIAKTNQEMADHLANVDQSRLGNNWTAGDMMYADINGDGVISTGENTLENHGDLSIIGNTTPRYNFGIIIDAQWKGFDLRVFLQGVGKRDYYPTVSGNGVSEFWGFMNNAKYQANLYEPQLDYFRPEDTTNPLGPNVDAYFTRPNYATGTKNKETQTHFLQNAAYCALKNLTIGYTIPQKVTRKAYLENVRIFFSGENLGKITKFTKLGDPEMIEAYNQNNFGKVYPLSRVFSCGLNVTF
ncbi:MAG: TonB-dependent receptor [Paramuribaculum sp.]|nr:TonB-dependent receptor [Paramuribaculum sp.]